MFSKLSSICSACSIVIVTTIMKSTYVELEIDTKNYAAFFNLQRLDKNFITYEIFKNINNHLKDNQNFSNKNIAYGHFILANYYRKKKEINLEIKELTKVHEIFFNSDQMNKKADNYWLETVPKMVSKNILFKFEWPRCKRHKGSTK